MYDQEHIDILEILLEKLVVANGEIAVRKYQDRLFPAIDLISAKYKGLFSESETVGYAFEMQMDDLKNIDWEE